MLDPYPSNKEPSFVVETCKEYNALMEEHKSKSLVQTHALKIQLHKFLLLFTCSDTCIQFSWYTEKKQSDIQTKSIFTCSINKFKCLILVYWKVTAKNLGSIIAHKKKRCGSWFPKSNKKFHVPYLSHVEGKGFMVMMKIMDLYNWASSNFIQG